MTESVITQQLVEQVDRLPLEFQRKVARLRRAVAGTPIRLDGVDFGFTILYIKGSCS